MRNKIKWLLVAFVIPMGLNALVLADGQESSVTTMLAASSTPYIPPAWYQKLSASKRFKLVLGGAAVLDKETGLVWEKSPSTNKMDWYAAVSYAYDLNVGGRKGWRLPTIEELDSLVDKTQRNPALPSGHPFTNVQSNYYWSSTTVIGSTGYAWGVDLSYGDVLDYDKGNYVYVWCVRGGHGYDAY